MLSKIIRIRVTKNSFGKYHLSKEFENGNTILWESCLLKKHAIAKALKLANFYRVTVMLDLRGDKDGKETN